MLGAALQPMSAQQGVEPGAQVTPRGRHTSTGAAGGAAGTVAGGGTGGAGIVFCAGSTRGCAWTLAGRMNATAKSAVRASLIARS
jgi:hypothetical protein